MTIFDDLVAEVNAYAENHVQLDLIDIDLDGSAVNEGETVSFSVRVTNNGPLELTGVSLKLAGRNGATVRLAFFHVFSQSVVLVPQAERIGANGGTEVFSRFSLLANDTTQGPATLVAVTLESYTLDPAPLYASQGDPGDVPKATFTAEVDPL